MAASGALLAGCSTLPTAGPSTNEVFGQAKNDSDSKLVDNYVVADIDAKVLSLLKAQASPSLYDTFGNVRSDEQGTIRAGDQIQVTIWETGPGGLFSNSQSTTTSLTPGQTTQIPPQVVATDGTVLVPYAGRPKVAGLSLPDAQALVQERLKHTAAQPQVLLTFAASVADQVTVSGDNIKGGLIPLAQSSGRVLDVIALSGGILGPTYAAWVQVVRSGVSVTEPLQDIIQNLRDNIQLQPGDNLIVSKNPEVFTALGASGTNLVIPFDSKRVSLVQALGKAGGLLDQRADPAGVFVFRYEPRGIASQLCADCRLPEGDGPVPVVFRLNLRNSVSMFTAQSFQMSNQDVLYIANAQQVQVQKALNVLSSFLSPVLAGAVVDNAVTR